MRYAVSLLLLALSAVSASAQGPEIVNIWSAYEKSPDKLDLSKPFEMVPLKVLVRYANHPDELAFYQGATEIRAERLPGETAPKEHHIFRLSALRFGRFAVTARAKKANLVSPEIMMTVNGPPAPEILAVYDGTAAPVALPEDRKQAIKGDTFTIVVRNVESDDKFVATINDSAINVTKVQSESRTIDVTLDATKLKPTDKVELKLRLVRNGWGSAWSAPVVLVLPAKENKAAEIKPVAATPVAREAKFVLLYPFWEGPQVELIGDAAGECSTPPSWCTLEGYAKKTGLTTFKPFRFPGAASFPQPRFDENGCRLDGPGTIIYEGMQLLVAVDGRYEVAFNASTPRVPVTLRLSLVVHVKNRNDPVRLTLPAIAIEPNHRSSDLDAYGSTAPLGNNLQQNWHVRHVGYSKLLADELRQTGEIVRVERDGVARFGSMPQSR